MSAEDTHRDHPSSPDWEPEQGQHDDELYEEGARSARVLDELGDLAPGDRRASDVIREIAAAGRAAHPAQGASDHLDPERERRAGQS